jgi:hypothetical protein
MLDLILDPLLSWKYSFWAVAFLIVAFDSIVLLAPGEFAFSFGRDGRARLRIAAIPFLIRARELIILAVSFFARPYFISSVNASDIGEKQLAGLRILANRQRSIATFSVLTVALAFIAGPILTAQIDIGHALLAVLPFIYLNALVAVTVIAAARKAWRIAPKNVFYIAFELLVCPVLVVNLNKRLAYRAAAVPNTYQLIGADGHARTRILQNLEFHDLPAPQSEHG